MDRVLHLIISFTTLAFAIAAPQNVKFINDQSKLGTTQAPVVPSPGIPLFNLFFPPGNVKQGGYSGQSFLDLSGLAPTTVIPEKQKPQMLGGVDFGELSQLCQTMAAMNRANKMNAAARTAASKPSDPTGWLELIRQSEPILLDNFACKMIERIITNPQDFVSDLLRLFMPAATANMLQQQIPNFAPNFGLPMHTTTTYPPALDEPTPMPATITSGD